MLQWNKIRKLRMISEVENWLWKSNFGTFWHLSFNQFSKFNNFLWLCWFLGKNPSTFVHPAWKLDNPYCHSWGLEDPNDLSSTADRSVRRTLVGQKIVFSTYKVLGLRQDYSDWQTSDKNEVLPPQQYDEKNRGGIAKAHIGKKVWK